MGNERIRLTATPPTTEAVFSPSATGVAFQSTKPGPEGRLAKTPAAANGLPG